MYLYTRQASNSEKIYYERAHIIKKNMPKVTDYVTNLTTTDFVRHIDTKS